jgi:hypothetical protein
MRLPLLLVVLSFWAWTSAQATVSFHLDTNPGAIPDGSVSGLSRSFDLDIAGETIVSLEIGLAIRGVGPAFLGDLYVYITDGTNLVTLLNRPGRDESTPDGYDDNQSINITFNDAATDDIHIYRISVTGSAEAPLASALTGNFQPDGRPEDPTAVTTSSPRTLSLSDFYGLSAQRTFTLFVADLSTGASHELESWSITVETVPEPSSILLLTTGAAFAFRRRRTRHCV